MTESTVAKPNLMKSSIIGLLGQPNTGKSTLFNAMTGARQHVGNWPGKTVEKKEGVFNHNGKNYTIIDMPGTYSLSANSEEELITRKNIINENIDVILLLVDASQLERSMFLLAELVGMKQPVIVLLNMTDVAKDKGYQIDSKKLSKLLGVPVLPLVAARGDGMDEVYDILEKKNYHDYRLHVNELRTHYEKAFGSEFLELEKILQKLNIESYTSMWLAIKLLESDSEITERIHEYASKDVWNNIQRILKNVDNGLLTSADCKFNWLHEIAKMTIVKKSDKESILGKFDKIATSHIFGQLMALCIIAFAMYASFKIGYTLMNAVGVVYGYAMQLAYTGMAAINAPSFLTGLICDALITGVFYSLMMTFFVLGMTLVFGLIEEIGYMARISYVFDNTMQRLGLHGKAIMPFLLSFGCTIAGVSGTRVIDSGKQRLLAIATCWIVPCSAMWGVISLMGSTFFGANAIWIILLLFAVAFIYLKVTATLFGRSLNIKDDKTGLIMELPPYHKPNYKALLREVWLRVTGIFRKAVKVIVGVTMVFWILSYTKDGNITGSFIYKFGTMIEPVTMFFGLSWELFIAFLISAIGKESSLGVITTLFARHTAMGNVYNAAFLGTGLVTGDVASGMLSSISAPQALAFMFAFFFNVPCFMTVAATVGEIHSTKWTLRIVFYYLISSLLIAGIVYRIAVLFI